MVIGIDASQANREQRSGTEWYAFYLIEHFKKLLPERNDVRVRLYFRDEPKADLKKDLPKNFEIKKLKWPINHFWAQGRLALEMLFYPPDFLFSPAHTIPLIHPKKTFTTLHDIGFEDNPELYDRLSLWYHRFSAKLAVKKAHHIFTISEYSKKRIIEKYNCPEGKLTVTYLGFDKEKFKPPDQGQIDEILKKYKLEDKKYFLFLGRLEPKKNIARIIEAYKILKKSLGKAPEMVFAGKEIDLSGVDKKAAKFLGYIDESHKPALYAGATAFVFPTLYEGFGLPILEAQASGTPVITSNTTSNPEIAGRGALIVDPRNVNEIYFAMKQIIENEIKKTDLLRAGLENIKRFSWRKTAEETLNQILN